MGYVRAYKTRTRYFRFQVVRWLTQLKLDDLEKLLQ